MGVPTICGRVTKATYQEVISRVDQKLTRWKAKCLSLAGRATLIQATIMAIPAYTMQTARVPRLICDEIDRKIRRFQWGSTSTERKPHLIAWEVVTKEKECVGLGLRSMALLMKLGWRPATEPMALLARVMKGKYCKGGDLEEPMHARSSSNVWRRIMETR